MALCGVLNVSLQETAKKPSSPLFRNRKRNLLKFEGVFLELKLWQVEVTPENTLQAPVCVSAWQGQT